MKKYVLFAVLVCSFTLPSFAQRLGTIRKLSEELQNQEFFKQYVRFKRKFEQRNKEMNGKFASYAEYERLNIAYNKVEKAYNDFLGHIKKDLSDVRTIKEMVKNPDGFALKYFDDYKAVQGVYTTVYLPVYNVTKTRSLTRSVSPALLEVSAQMLLEIVKIIGSRRKDAKEAATNILLAQVNAHFYNKLRMKTWAELEIAVPEADTGSAASAPVAPAPETANASAKNGKTSTGFIPPIVTTRLSSQVDVGYQMFDELRGSIAFEQHTKQGLIPMLFGQKTRSITVQTLDIKGTDVVAVPVSAPIAHFTTSTTYPVKTQFGIKVNNSAGMYILALNEGCKVDVLYPMMYKNEPTRSIEVKDLDASFVEGKDKNDYIYLPPPNNFTTPPTPKAFTIDGGTCVAGQEDFLVVLSKAELNIDQIAEQIQAAQGKSLEDRVALVFAGKLIAPTDAGVSVSGNSITFDASASTEQILPLVFHIRRQ